MSISLGTFSIYASSGGFKLAQKCSTVLSSSILACSYLYYSYNKCCYCLLGCGLRTKFPGSQEKWNIKKICLLCFLQWRVNLSISSLFTAWFCMHCSSNNSCIHTYSDVAWDKCIQSLRRNISLLSHSWNYTLVQFGFYSIISLQIAYEIRNVFIVVNPTQKWPATKNTESPDASTSTEFCPCE